MHVHHLNHYTIKAIIFLSWYLKTCWNITLALIFYHRYPSSTTIFFPAPFFIFPSKIVLNSFSGSSCLFSANKPLAQCKGLRIRYCKNPSVLGIIQMALEMLESLSDHTISACEPLGLHLQFSGNHEIIEVGSCKAYTLIVVLSL